MKADIGAVYIARGLDPNWAQRFRRFVESYHRHPAGIEFQLYIFYKQFDDAEALTWARGLFSSLHPIEILNHMDAKTVAGCTAVGEEVKEPILCSLNSSSEIMHDDWMKKLYDAFSIPGVGLVGCTGSRVANLHIRDTAILIDRVRYLTIAKPFDWEDPFRRGPLEFEHGHNTLTTQILASGEKVYVVEKDRIIPPEEWGNPTTYQGHMQNVLIHDRGARDYHDL